MPFCSARKYLSVVIFYYSQLLFIITKRMVPIFLGEFNILHVLCCLGVLHPYCTRLLASLAKTKAIYKYREVCFFIAVN